MDISYEANKSHKGHAEIGWQELDKAEVVVIGGGLAGLAASTYLARGGRDVTLFEKSSAVGGRAESQERSGAIFNLGAHALYTKSAAWEVLEELGVVHTGGSPVGIRATSHGENYLAPVDPPTLLRTSLLSVGEKWEMARLLAKLQFSNPVKLDGIGLREWAQTHTSNPKIRALLEATARVSCYTNAPEQLSLGHFAEQLQILAKSKVTYVDGGWQTLVNGLEKAARVAGVRMITGARVEAVEHNSGSVTGVRLANGSTIQAQAVIIAACPRDAQHLVAGGDSTVLRTWAERAVPAKAACLDLVLRRLPRPENKVVIDVERPLFLATQSEFSKVTPGGGVLVYSLKYLDPSAPQDADANRRELEEWLDQTQPGWRSELVEQRYLPNLVVTNAFVQASLGGNSGRPGPEVPGISNLFVAGDWVGARGMLASTSLWSAKLAAQSVLARKSGERVPAMSRAA